MDRASSRRHITRAVALAGLLVLGWVGACSDDPGAPELPPPPPRPGLFVSDPAAPAAASAGRAGAASIAAAPGDSVVYVSLPPGTVPRGDVATIGNRRTGSTATALLVGGGFDPVPVAANAGDTLDVEVRLFEGGAAVQLVVAVPAARRPIVVRTDPPPRKRDVPLNASMVVVFSEPIDSASLTGTSVQLLRGSVPVAGRVEVGDSAHLVAAFVPNAPLAANATYTLIVTQGVRDLDGEPLEAPVSVEFTTVIGAPPGLIAFEAIEKIWIMNADGSLPTVLTDNVVWRSGVSRSIAWSPDGAKIAFIGSAGGTDDRADEIYVINVDGSALTRLTYNTASERDPDWSPDGKRIAFASDRDGQLDIYVMNADGSGAERLTTLGAVAPAWSPDGKEIAFAVAGNIIYVMNRNGSGIARLSDPDGGHDPVWSPDGMKIAFWSARGGGYDQIYSMNADGSGVTRLTDGSHAAYHPSWSPSSRIAFVGVVGMEQLYVMSDDGSGVTRLGGPTEGFFGGQHPAWSPVTTRLPFSLSIQKAPSNSGDGQSDTVLATLPDPLRVLVLRDGAPAPGVAVSWNAYDAGLSATTTTTDQSGIASVELTLSRISYAHIIEARVPGAAGSPARLSAYANPGNPVGLVGDSVYNNQVGAVDEPVYYLVTVTDAYGNRASSATTRLDWTVVSGGGSIATAQSTTNAGQAWATHTLGPTDGVQTATATATELPGLPRVTFATRAVTAIVLVSVSDDAGNHCLNLFSPTDVTVPTGRTVAWVWDCAERSHNVTFEDDPTQPTSSPTGFDRHLRTFTTPGVYRYRCTLHSASFAEGEVGTVTVQ